MSSKEVRFRLLALMALFVFLASLVFVVPARADGGAPPSPPPATASSAVNLSQVPAGTNVVVVDNGGHKVPLGTQKAAEIMSTGDPVWCPSAVLMPMNGAGGCSPAGSSLAAVIAWMAGAPAVNGTIWIENSYDRSTGDAGSTSFSLNGSVLTNAGAHDLTIKGGWNGIGTNTITGSSTISGASLAITNWNGNIFLSNLIVSGASGDGLTIQTSKNISLSGVQSNGNSGAGANLNNTSGTGTVTVTNGEFDSNAGEGVDVYSKGAITFNDLTANFNGLHAAYLDNTAAASAQPVKLNGKNVFANNYYGLDVESKGAITVNNITSTSNPGGWGAYLVNDTSSTPQAVTLTGKNTFDANWGGLYVLSKGAINTNTLTAEGNTGNAGVYLDNCSYTDSTTGCAFLTYQPVTMNGTNVFNNNAWDGLVINTLGNVVITNNLTTTGNAVGAYIDNCQSYDASGNGSWGCSSSSPHTVTLSGANTLSNNRGMGLYLASNGAIKTNNVTASFNGGYGALIESWASTPQAVTLAGDNAFNNNYSIGLTVYAYGLLTINNITAKNNGQSWTTTDPYREGIGAYLSNWSTAGVVLTGKNIFEGNYSEYIDTTYGYDATYGGLTIISNGAVKLNNITANNDLGGAGVYVDACNYRNSGTAPAGCLGSQAVTFTGVNTFNSNHIDGLDVYSYGNITAGNLNASLNGGTGVWLKNDYNKYYTGLASKGTVTLSGTNVFNGNTGEGLHVQSYGAVKASNINAVSNTGGDGAYLDNKGAATAQPITLTNSNVFSYNGGNGLEVYSKGAITLSSFTADGNTGNDGVLLDNCLEAVPGTPPCTNTFISNITLTGNSVANYNHNNGLEVYSAGMINVNTTTLISNWNGDTTTYGSAVILDNSGAAKPQAVNLKGVNLFDGNAGTHLVILSKGAITASNITAVNNIAGTGVFLENATVAFSGAVGGVTLTGTNVFNNNAFNGLGIFSSGAVTVNNVTANGNGTDHINIANKYGIRINNTFAATAQPVTLSGYVFADNNWYGGIQVLSKGAVKASNVSAVGNQNSDGAVFDTSAGASTASVTLSGTNFFDGNAGDGLLVNAGGAVSLTKITANQNGGDGLNASTPLTMVLVCGAFVNNTGYGININTGGAASLTGAVMIGNTMGDTVHQSGGGAVTIIPTCTLP